VSDDILWVGDRKRDLQRIEEALAGAGRVFERFSPGSVPSTEKSNLSPVTEADLAVDQLLRECLVEAGEGWLSEETQDGSARLSADRVWVVDPLDGTKEFVAGIPEWCVSVGLIEQGEAVAGGVLNPAAGFMAVGAKDSGCTLNGQPVPTTNARLDGTTVLASRTEVSRGEWSYWDGTRLNITPMGSVAYKLARVACGLADATWTLVPKHEWDVAAGVALVLSAGGSVSLPSGEPVLFNQRSTLLPGLVAIAYSAQSRFDLDEIAQSKRASTYEKRMLPYTD
jgi:myo-inositol-1(or 4)-monophosphatase